MQVRCRDSDERGERTVGAPLPVELSHRGLLSVTGGSAPRKVIISWLRVHARDFVPIPCLVMTHDKDHRPAFERRYWPCYRLRNIRLASFCQHRSPRDPILDRGVHASGHRFQLPSGAVLVPVLAEQFSDWHLYGFWPPVPLVWRAERGADLGMFRSAGERGSEGIWVGNASRQFGAYMPLVIWL